MASRGPSSSSSIASEYSLQIMPMECSHGAQMLQSDPRQKTRRNKIAKIRSGMARINTIKARESQCTAVFGLVGRAAQRETGTESTTANAVAKKTMARVSTIIAVSSPIGGKSNGNMWETKL